jgi:hypothetical protein
LGNLYNFRECLNSFMYVITSMVVIAFVIKQLFHKYVYNSQIGEKKNNKITKQLSQNLLNLFHTLILSSHSMICRKNEATVNKLQLRQYYKVCRLHYGKRALRIIPSLSCRVTLSRLFYCLLLNHLPSVRWENFLQGFIKIR